MSPSVKKDVKSRPVPMLERIRIDKKSFRNLRQIIYERSGISVTEGKEYLLENRLADRLKVNHCKSFEEYDYFLRYEPGGEAEIVRMVECITTNETYFFREESHFTMLREEILPQLAEQKRFRVNPLIRIWSAASSTGEEPYTISIVVEEAKRNLSGVRVEILASDINDAVIRSARRGIYEENSVRHIPPDIRTRYFSKEGARYRLDEKIKSQVRFVHLNLVDKNRLRSASGMDIIFCKNVLIYFDPVMKKKVVESLYDSLLPGGYLLIGRSEALHDISRAFRPMKMKNGLVYRKE
ncbi:MAG: protein-glutamate O-methyltransferase CheR [Deltaproteobacteria bacterium]|nr:protein-glutamate O-methyltransferase CheR [Deltaproteobacteria bacterium]